MTKNNQFLPMLWVILAIADMVILKQSELGEEPDYYPKVNPNPINIEELNIDDIPVYFDLFNRFYEVDYKSDEHLNKSYEIFADNIKRLIIMNKFSTAAKFAINEFTHLSWDEFTDKYTGFNDTEVDETNVNTFEYNSTQGAPRNLDWRALGLPPLVRHQGPCKSSYVFSTIANIEAQVAKNFKRTIRLSDQQAYDCEPSGTCKYGGAPHKVMEAIMKIGGIEEQMNYVYDPKDQRECKLKEDLMVVSIKNIQRFKPLYEVGLIALLALYGPIVTTMFVSESVKNYHRGVLWPTDCDKKPNHAVLLVGYGVTADSIPYWIIKNSWGMLWGEAGYIRLIRGEHACNIGQYVATATVELIDRSNSTKLKQELSPFQQNVSVVINSLTLISITHSTTEHLRTKKQTEKTSSLVHEKKSPTPKSNNDLPRKENLYHKIITASKLVAGEGKNDSDEVEDEAKNDTDDDEDKVEAKDDTDDDDVRAEAKTDTDDDEDKVEAKDDTDDDDVRAEAKDDTDDDDVRAEAKTDTDDDENDIEKIKRKGKAVRQSAKRHDIQRAVQPSSSDTQEEFTKNPLKKAKERKHVKDKVNKMENKDEKSGTDEESDFDVQNIRMTKGIYLIK